jgi:endonuclease G
MISTYAPRWFGFAAFLSLALLATGCAGGGRSTQLMRAPHTEMVTLQSGELTAEEESLLAGLCPFGAPALGAYYGAEPVTHIVREGYAMAHNDSAKTPVWVCENVLHADVHGGLTGRDSWGPDPVLCPTGSRQRCMRGAVDNDYKNSGYDRGHLAPNWNQRRSEDRKRETFYFSNAAPQIGRKFNQSVWQDLERDLTTRTASLDRLWTITGVLYYEEEEDAEATADGFLTVEAIGEGGVLVPTHFYKIVVSEDDGETRAFAVVMENRAYGAGESFRDAANLRSIRWLEERLDVDFMPELEPGEADALELETGQPFP